MATMFFPTPMSRFLWYSEAEGHLGCSIPSVARVQLKGQRLLNHIVTWDMILKLQPA